MPPAIKIDARLRIPAYTNMAGTDTREVQFQLWCDRVQKSIKRPVVIFAVPAPKFASGEIIAVDFQRYEFAIAVVGVVESATHAHAQVANPHDPDHVDIEEACIYWPTSLDLSGQTNFTELRIESSGGIFRVYKGLIAKLDITRDPAVDMIRFSLVFQVVVRPTPLREWN